MKIKLRSFSKSTLRESLKKYGKYAPILFFIGGFIFDTLTLGRIDRTYDLFVLCLHMTCLSISLYIYNLADDGAWKHTFIEKYTSYLPLVIQFFFGGLSSAYVIYFSRSVSLSKTASFFLILVALLIANEFLKKRISNKYLQFGVYYFISFTFFTFMIPVFIKKLNPTIFLISGAVSLSCTLILIVTIYAKSASTRAEIKLGKLIGLILSIYAIINLFYFLRLIPPVPLALDEGVVAHDVQLKDNSYLVSYEKDKSFIQWRKHKTVFHFGPEDTIYVFSSIFAPTGLEKEIIHRWQWFDQALGEWQILDEISYNITGGRDDGYRGYTYKANIAEGAWRVEVITRDELVLGVVKFEVLYTDEELEISKLFTSRF